MAKKETKYYVVWVGAEPGVYTDWENCKKQVDSFPGAKYKSYKSKEEAELAFYTGHDAGSSKKECRPSSLDRPCSGLAVDAACSGNPGKMEYRGVDISTNREVFHVGPFFPATNNIGEFLALVHGLALMAKSNSPLSVYSDSVTAMSWIKHKQCKTHVSFDKLDPKVGEMIVRAVRWLNGNDFESPLKWRTEDWGEIPADFGRK